MNSYSYLGLSNYIVQFEIIARINNGIPLLRLLELAICLRGPASGALAVNVQAKLWNIIDSETKTAVETLLKCQKYQVFYPFWSWELLNRGDGQPPRQAAEFI